MSLRGLLKKDADGMLEWMNDPEIRKNFRFSAESRDKNDAMNFIKEASVELIEGKSIHYAIVDENDEYLGTVSLKNINLSARNAEFAISLRKKAQGKGIGYKSTMELLKMAFGRYDLQRVYLNVLTENLRAIRMYEKCGFIYEGEFRKHLFLYGEYKSLKWYGLLKEEFQLRQKSTGNLK